MKALDIEMVYEGDTTVGTFDDVSTSLTENKRCKTPSIQKEKDLFLSQQSLFHSIYQLPRKNETITESSSNFLSHIYNLYGWKRSVLYSFR